MDGFPWTSVRWYRVQGEGVASLSWLANLYLFWNGVAWGDGREILSRKLKQGVDDFKRIAADILKFNYDGCIIHLADILSKRDSYRTGYKDDKPFLILVGQTEESPLMILDGNHRAVAALWWAIENGKDDHLPRRAWLGLSADMPSYKRYNDVLKAHRINESTALSG